jgi:ribosome biogenesis GTPase
MSNQNALVIATYSRRMRLQLDEGTCVDARIKGKRLRPVCGDRVLAEPIAGEDDWLITALDKRRNQLTRPNRRGRVEILAANIDLLVVVSAPLPRPDWFVVDRYLCAAENMPADAAVVFNKIDLGEPGSSFEDYAAVGYPVSRCSATTGDGIDELRSLMTKRIAIIVGQSGVGKSSIINAIFGRERLPTGVVSAKTREGRHTTVNSQMLSLPGGGAVIDSPGVRDYAPALETPAEVIHGFREIAAAGRQCRFSNCRHLREPGCSVKAAVDRGDISSRRYESFKRAMNILARRPG